MKPAVTAQQLAHAPHIMLHIIINAFQTANAESVVILMEFMKDVIWVQENLFAMNKEVTHNAWRAPNQVRVITENTQYNPQTYNISKTWINDL